MASHVLIKCWEEVGAAREELEEMRIASDLDALVPHWLEFLRWLERSWYKFESYVLKNSRLHGWTDRGKVISLRESDPLLAYLRYARGADEHSVEEIAAQEWGSIAVTALDEQPLFDIEISIDAGQGIKQSMRATCVNELGAAVSHIKDPGSKAVVANQSVCIKFKAAKLRLLGIAYRRRRYEPPTSHLDLAPIELGPVEAAELGLRFYEDYYSRSEAFIQPRVA